MRARVIINPIAGQRRAQRNVDRLQQALRARDIIPDVVITTHPGDATRAAAEAAREGYDRVIVGAGDGTINEVVNGLAGSEAVLGVVPLGTGNVFACNAGVPLSVEGACEVVARGVVRRVDLGRANGRYFLLMAGIGFDAQVVSQVQPRVKNILRGFAYVLTTVNTFFRYQPSRLTLTLDDREVLEQTAWLVIIGNVPSYAWEIKVTSLARLDDGRLDVCLFPQSGRWGNLRQTVHTLQGRHLECCEVEYRQARKIALVSDPPVPVQLDGDSAGMTPVEIVVVPRALQVVLPADQV